MAKINGTLMLVYADGVVVAAQKNVSVTWDNGTIDTTSKDSAGWEEHINGMRNATVDFDNLYSTTGISAEEFIAYITGRTSLVLLIDGLGYPIIGQARVKNINIGAGNEQASTFAGSLQFNGAAYMLSDAFAELFTSWTNGGYDTFTSTGTAITSAIEAGAGASADSTQTFAVIVGTVVKVIFFLTLNAGKVSCPRFTLYGGGSARSNIEQSAAGVNVFTLTSTYVGNVTLSVDNTVADCNWTTTKIYAFKG